MEQEQIPLGATITHATYFTPVPFSATLGPFRLGADLDGNADPPNFVEALTLLSTWYEDEATEYVESVGTESTDQFPAPSVRPILEDIGRLAIRAFGYIPGAEKVAKFTAVSINGTALDTRGLALADVEPGPQPHWEEIGAGSFNYIDPYFFDGYEAIITAAPGGQMDYDVVVRDFAGNVIAGAEVLDNWLTTVELHNGVQKTPFAATVPLTPTSYVVAQNTSYSRPSRNQPRATGHLSGPNAIALRMSDTWLAAQGWDPDDTPVVQDEVSLLTGAPSYSPLTVTHRATIEIDIPDGNRPSNWSINSGANGSVTEDPGDTSFIVTNIAARFRRDYATNWRSYVTFGFPDFTPDGYEITKHNYVGPGQTVYPEDVFWWNSHEFLKLNVTATVAAVLTLQIDGIDLEVADDMSVNEHADRRTYVAAVPSGTNDVWIDLSFPDSYVSGMSAPFPLRRPRVDTVTLGFSATGTFTVNSMELARRDAYPNQTQVAYSPVSNYLTEYPALYTRIDGTATVTLAAGDSFQKGQEREVGSGGAFRFVNVHFGGGAYTARDMVAQYDRVEGFVSSYNDAARAAFHRDGAGMDFVTQATEPAQWLIEETPGTNWTGAGDAHTWTPSLAIRVGTVQFPNGMIAGVKGRKRLGGGVESTACVGGARAGSGVNIAVKDETSTLATVATDNRGRVHYEPVKHGKTIRMQPV